MFVATTRTDYRVLSAGPVMRFVCVSDLDECRETLQDTSCTVVHYFQPIGGLDGASEEAFQLVELTVDGRRRPARRATCTGTQLYTASFGGKTAPPAGAHGRHLLHVPGAGPAARAPAAPRLQPAHEGLKVQFAYGGCGIRYVSVLDYIASSRQARVSRLPASAPTPSIAFGFDGWILPKAGAAFVWVLEGEMAQPVAGAERVAERASS